MRLLTCCLFGLRQRRTEINEEISEALEGGVRPTTSSALPKVGFAEEDEEEEGEEAAENEEAAPSQASWYDMTFASGAATSGDGGDPTSGEAAEEDIDGEEVATSDLPDFDDMVHVASSEVLIEDAIASNLTSFEAGGQQQATTLGGPSITNTPNEAWELRGTQWVRKTTTGSPTAALAATLAAQQFFIGDAQEFAHEARADNAFTI